MTKSCYHGVQFCGKKVGLSVMLDFTEAAGETIHTVVHVKKKRRL
jgi:hypothetical protein